MNYEFHQLFPVVKFFSENLNINTPAAVVFLDVAKAFEKSLAGMRALFSN